VTVVLLFSFGKQFYREIARFHGPTSTTDRQSVRGEPRRRWEPSPTARAVAPSLARECRPV